MNSNTLFGKSFHKKSTILKVLTMVVLISIFAGAASAGISGAEDTDYELEKELSGKASEDGSKASLKNPINHEEQSSVIKTEPMGLSDTEAALLSFFSAFMYVLCISPEALFRLSSTRGSLRAPTSSFATVFTTGI